MMEAAWEPGDAEQALAGVPAWSAAPPATVTAYAVASVRSWESAYARGRSSRVWLDIARAWAGHRAGLGAGRGMPGLGA